MQHAGRHEQAHGSSHISLATGRREHIVVVVNRVPRRENRVVPAVVEEEFAAVPDKLFQVGIDRVDGVVVQLVSKRDIGVVIERPVIPVRILKHKVFEMITRKPAARCAG